MKTLNRNWSRKASWPISPKLSPASCKLRSNWCFASLRYYLRNGSAHVRAIVPFLLWRFNKIVPAKRGKLIWTVINFSLAYLLKQVLIIRLQTVELGSYCDPDKISVFERWVDLLIRFLFERWLVLMLGKPYPWVGRWLKVLWKYCNIHLIFTQYIHLDSPR